MQQVMAEIAHRCEVRVQLLPNAIVSFVMDLRCWIVLAALTNGMRTCQDEGTALCPCIRGQIGVVLGAKPGLNSLVGLKIFSALPCMPLMLKLIIEGWDSTALIFSLCHLGRDRVASMTAANALTVISRTTIRDCAQAQFATVVCTAVLSLNGLVSFLLYRKVRQGPPCTLTPELSRPAKRVRLE